MSIWSLSAITVTNISQSFTYKMAAEISWDRCGTKLRHCRPMSTPCVGGVGYLGVFRLSPCVLSKSSELVSRELLRLLCKTRKMTALDAESKSVLYCAIRKFRYQVSTKYGYFRLELCFNLTIWKFHHAISIVETCYQLLFFSRLRSEGWPHHRRTYALSPFISLLCHSNWLFHGESCPRLDIRPGRAWSSSPACTWHCSLHYLFLQATHLFPHVVTILC